MEQLIFFLIFGLIAFANWLLKRARESASEEQTPPVHSPMSQPRHTTTMRTTVSVSRTGSDSEMSEEERVRKFMEALGIPTGNVPPRPVQAQPPPVPQQRRTAPPPVPASAPQPPPLVHRQERPVSREQRNLTRTQRPPDLVVTPQPVVRDPERIARAVEAFEEARTRRMGVDQTTSAEMAERKRVQAKRSSPAGEVHPVEARDWLSDPAALRRAVILREILGPPKALQ